MGRGYVQILMDYATTEMKTKFPRLQEKVTCSLTQHGLRPGSRPVFQEVKWYILIVMQCLAFLRQCFDWCFQNVVGQECLPQTLLEGLAKMADTQRPNTQHLNLCQSLDLLQDDGIIQRFFSFPYILAHPPWLPVLPDKTSLRRLALCHDVIATFHSDVNSECCTDISYALVLKGTKVLAIEIFYYGNNMSVLETHTLMHVKRFTKHLCDGKRPSLFIHYRHSADHLTPGVEDFFLRLLGQPGKRWDATIAAASI